MTSRSCHFSHIITRLPPDSAVQGLRAVDTGAPDLALMRAHHADYRAALAGAGCNVTVLEALEAFPDSLFVEDTALCLPEGAVAMRPGAPSRLGEAAAMVPHLRAFYPEVAMITGTDAFIEAGDILMTETEVLVGRSARTNAAGIAALRAILSRWGVSLREVATPPGVLHFKTDCAIVAPDTILSTPRLSASGCFKGYRVIDVAAGEEAAANVIAVNDRILMPAGFPRTREALEGAGLTVIEIGNSECGKLDGGMSCLSLRFTPPKAPS